MVFKERLGSSRVDKLLRGKGGGLGPWATTIEI